MRPLGVHMDERKPERFHHIRTVDGSAEVDLDRISGVRFAERGSERGAVLVDWVGGGTAEYECSRPHAVYRQTQGWFPEYTKLCDAWRRRAAASEPVVSGGEPPTADAWMGRLADALGVRGDLREESTREALAEKLTAWADRQQRRGQ